MKRFRPLKTAQKGFTLIELVITIVIIGILAAVAIPKFVDLTGDANAGVAKGIASAAASASSVNYAKRAAGGSSTGTAVANCSALTSLVSTLPIGFAIAPAVANATLPTDGTTGACVVTYPGNTTGFAFQAYGA